MTQQMFTAVRTNCKVHSRCSRFTDRALWI